MLGVAKARLPVYVVEDHDEALCQLYRCIGAKQLPLDGLQLLHFDSHPDLNVPESIDADDVFCKDKLFASLSIENWIVPALYAGHVNSIVWVKCEWATEIPDGTYEFQVGRHRQSGKLRLTLPFGHFVSELAYAPKEDLENAKEVALHVVTWDSSSAHDDCSDLAATTARLLEIVRQPYVLDVDMDFFSTRNPLTDLYSDRQLGLLRQLYSLDDFPEAASTKDLQGFERLHLAAVAAVEQRRILLDNLRKGLLEEGCRVVNKAQTRTYQLDATRQVQLLQLVSESRRQAEAEGASVVDWELLHEHGCTFDSCGLPHHVSSPEVIQRLAAAMGSLLCLVPAPAVVTLARSSADDYCPKEQVEHIQELLLKIVEDSFQRCLINKVYQ